MTNGELVEAARQAQESVRRSSMIIRVITLLAALVLLAGFVVFFLYYNAEADRAHNASLRNQQDIESILKRVEAAQSPAAVEATNALVGHLVQCLENREDVDTHQPGATLLPNCEPGDFSVLPVPGP